jgi:hypothetical protein
MWTSVKCTKENASAAALSPGVMTAPRAPAALAVRNDRLVMFIVQSYQDRNARPDCGRAFSERVEFDV